MRPNCDVERFDRTSSWSVRRRKNIEGPVRLRPATSELLGAAVRELPARAGTYPHAA
jgi:hypothetical protein